ncbi:MAG: DNA recombination/repair protein RecA, partial [Thermodesulfobacteriota bacterium]
DILDMGAKLNIIEKSGTWYSYDGIRIGQGREAGRAFLMEHIDKAFEIEDKILRQYGLKGHEKAPQKKEV